MSEKVSSSSKKAGRPTVEYPDCLEELCVSWRARDVMASEFMRRTELKEGNFLRACCRM